MATNVYLPDGSSKIVVPDDKVQDYLARGYIGQEQYMILEKQRTEQEHQEWLQSPDTVAERFQMLRSARDAKIAETDYLVLSDYPVDSSARTSVLAYRAALRDLPAQDGAPWDGGGELTPWPVKPDVSVLH